MEPDKKVEISASTNYRFAHAKRIMDLPSFSHFKQEFQSNFDESRIQSIKRIYPHGICGRNQHRHTVVVDRVGNIKIQQLSKVFEDDEMVSYFNQRLLHLSENVLQEREQVVWIIDLSGKIMQLASKKILQALAKIIANAQKYFPELLHKLVFVNTPMLFDTIWNKINLHISKATLQKIIMIGDEVDNLYQFAEPAILPDFLGGDVEEEVFLSDCKQPKEKQDEEQQSDQEQQFDFSSLKQALSGLKVGGNSMQSVSQTPLNTEADDR